MTTNALSVRPATADDSRKLFEWRNDEQTRAVSLSTDEIAWPDHDRWFTASLSNPRRFIYIAEAVPGDNTDNGDNANSATRPVGMVRFDIDDAGEYAEVSINLNPDARGKGYGTVTLVEGIRRFELDRPDLRGTTALIRDTNAPSVAIFAKAGFTAEGSADGVGHYRREREPN